MATTDPTPTKSEKALISAAEVLIDTAMAELLLAAKGVRDAGKAQEVAIAELRNAREALRLLREQVDRSSR
jgi:delta 1-pyrroline-5-carboxylate dehydrogenase